MGKRSGPIYINGLSLEMTSFSLYIKVKGGEKLRMYVRTK